MASKARIPNKTQWALGDILAHCKTATDRWERLMALAEQRIDPQAALQLAQMRHDIAEIRRLASDALEGNYNGKE